MTSYREAGVDLESAARAVEVIADLAARASRPEVAGGVGGFAGLYRLSGGRLLAAAADGAGTKAEVARLAGRLSTIGIDVVAMCADDVVCAGAEPLFFLDYLAMGTVDPPRVAAIVAGVAEGCRRAGCALLGGETAEHPGILDPDRFDLAGFCVGLVEDRVLLGPHRTGAGDVLIGLASSGLHANGFSLVRRVLLGEGGYGLEDVPEGLGRPLGEELLEPTAVYAPLVLELADSGLVHGAAHVTGGGIPGNLPRCLRDGLSADVDWSAWPVPPVFELVRRVGEVPEDEMRRTFNMGIGMVLVVPDWAEGQVLRRAAARGTAAYPMGSVRSD